MNKLPNNALIPISESFEMLINHIDKHFAICGIRTESQIRKPNHEDILYYINHPLIKYKALKEIGTTEKGRIKGRVAECLFDRCQIFFTGDLKQHDKRYVFPDGFYNGSNIYVWLEDKYKIHLYNDDTKKFYNNVFHCKKPENIKILNEFIKEDSKKWTTTRGYDKQIEAYSNEVNPNRPMLKILVNLFNEKKWNEVERKRSGMNEVKDNKENKNKVNENEKSFYFEKINKENNDPTDIDNYVLVVDGLLSFPTHISIILNFLNKYFETHTFHEQEVLEFIQKEILLYSDDFRFDHALKLFRDILQLGLEEFYLHIQPLDFNNKPTKDPKKIKCYQIYDFDEEKYIIVSKTKLFEIIKNYVKDITNIVTITSSEKDTEISMRIAKCVTMISMNIFDNKFEKNTLPTDINATGAKLLACIHDSKQYNKSIFKHYKDIIPILKMLLYRKSELSELNVIETNKNKEILMNNITSSIHDIMGDNSREIQNLFKLQVNSSQMIEKEKQELKKKLIDLKPKYEIIHSNKDLMQKFHKILNKNIINDMDRFIRISILETLIQKDANWLEPFIKNSLVLDFEEVKRTTAGSGVNGVNERSVVNENKDETNVNDEGTNDRREWNEVNENKKEVEKNTKQNKENKVNKVNEVNKKENKVNKVNETKEKLLHKAREIGYFMQTTKETRCERIDNLVKEADTLKTLNEINSLRTMYLSLYVPTIVIDVVSRLYMKPYNVIYKELMKNDNFCETPMIEESIRKYIKFFKDVHELEDILEELFELELTLRICCVCCKRSERNDEMNEMKRQYGAERSEHNEMECEMKNILDYHEKNRNLDDDAMKLIKKINGM